MNVRLGCHSELRQAVPGATCNVQRATTLVRTMRMTMTMTILHTTTDQPPAPQSLCRPKAEASAHSP
eukprot:scaffold30360_cov166-Skeletonema_menzelii.AAC.1